MSEQMYGIHGLRVMVNAAMGGKMNMLMMLAAPIQRRPFALCDGIDVSIIAIT